MRPSMRRRILARVLVIIISAAFLALLSACQPEPIPQPRVVTPIPIQAVPQPQSHPRLFFGSQDISILREQARTTHRDMWAPILSFAQSPRTAQVPAYPGKGDLDGFRNAGNQLIALSFAFVITEDRKFLDMVRDRMMAYVGWQEWGDEGDYGYRDLGFHQMLLGNAIAFDWLYQDLPESDRQVIAQNLGRRAQQSYEASTSPTYEWNNWWRKAYSQNHHWTNNSSLGIAALVLEGEDARAPEWLAHAVDEMSRDSALLTAVDDGSWHEGMAYQTYGLSLSLPFYQNLRRIKGQDLIPHSYLKNYVYWRIYNSLPGSDRFLLSYSDLEWAWGDPYGPEGLLRFAAREYRDEYAEGMAQAIANRGKRQVNVYSAPWYVFEFLYYDPTVQGKSPQDLSPNRVFPDADSVVWRTGWQDNDLVFGLKSGALGGRAVFDRFVRQDYPFDPSTNVDILNSGHDHGDANTFYLYKGNVELSAEMTAGNGDTAVHNTILVDGQGQYLPQDYWNPAVFAGTDGRLESVGWTANFSYLVAEAANRYRAGADGNGPGSPMLSEFRRHVLFVKPGYLVMVDRLRSDSSRRYDWVSHFPSAVTVESNWIKGQTQGDQLLGVKVLYPNNFVTETGNDGKPYIRVRATNPVQDGGFVTVLFPTDNAGWGLKPPISILEQNNQVSAIRVTLDGAQDHIINHGDREEGTAGDYAFSAKIASIARDPTGQLKRLFVGQGSMLADSRGTRPLIQAQSRLSALEVDYDGTSLALYGDNPTNLRVWGPRTDTARVTVNGQTVPARRDGEYLIIGG